MTTPCAYGDDTCPCQDGDQCHYEGPNPMLPPAVLAWIDRVGWNDAINAVLDARELHRKPAMTPTAPTRCRCGHPRARHPRAESCTSAACGCLLFRTDNPAAPRWKR